jgi:hypothetical protein
MKHVSVSGNATRIRLESVRKLAAESREAIQLAAIEVTPNGVQRLFSGFSDLFEKPRSRLGRHIGATPSVVRIDRDLDETAGEQLAQRAGDGGGRALLAPRKQGGHEVLPGDFLENAPLQGTEANLAGKLPAAALQNLRETAQALNGRVQRRPFAHNSNLR